MTNLELATIDELVGELARRFETFACVGQLATSNEEPSEKKMAWRYLGNTFTAMGLVVNLLHLMNTEAEHAIDRWDAKGDL